MNLEDLSKEELVRLVKMYAKNWLAHDGCWFLGAEETYGLNAAIELDKKSWKRFTVIEAKRIMKEFYIEEGSGLDGLERALNLRLYASMNVQEFERSSESKLVFKMKTCRVQAARERKKLPLFPCKEVGIIEYSEFAKTIDPRIVTKVISAPPDETNRDFHCGWEFTLLNA